MPTKFVYMPVLKWKQGEHRAVKSIEAKDKAKLLPMAEVPFRPYDYEKKKYKKTWDKHIDDVVEATADNWGLSHDIAVDQPLQPDHTLTSHAGTPWEYLFASLWNVGVRAVPVVSTRASAAEIAALISVAKSYKKTRWVLRYVVESEEDLPSTVELLTWFQNMLVALGASAVKVVPVLDVGYVGEKDPKALTAPIAQLLAALAGLGDWPFLVLASGAFPRNLTGVPKGTKQIPRKDWDLYKRVAASPLLKGASVLYGDFGVSHVEPFEDDPRKLNMSANLRYSHFTDWHVLKAKNVRDHGFKQYNDLCRILVLLPIYMGASFSKGDENYDDAANNPKAGPGNATSWRRDATNHHIQMVLHQLASPAWP